MKTWRCPGCNKERLSSNEIVMKICDACQVMMELIETRKDFVSKIIKGDDVNENSKTNTR